MEATDIAPLLEQLDDNIDDLEDALAPLITGALSDTIARLPLLDKAKLYVLVTYAIESILFSFLRLNGVNAKDHPVFRELTRVKQYFEKIKNAEFGNAKRENLKLNKPAAGRIVKHALAGNDRYDLERAKQQAKEKARAHIRFEQISNKRKADETEGLAADVDETPSSTSDSESTDDSIVAAANSLPESTKEHVVPGLEHDSGVDGGSMAGHGCKHAGKSVKVNGKVDKKGKAENKKRKRRRIVAGVEEPKGKTKESKSGKPSAAETHFEEPLRPKNRKRTPRPTRKQRVEKKEREAREGLNRHE